MPWKFLISFEDGEIRGTDSGVEALKYAQQDEIFVVDVEKGELIGPHHAGHEIEEVKPYPDPLTDEEAKEL